MQPQGLEPTRLLLLRDSPGKNTGVGCHSLLQRLFPTQGSNPHLLHCRQILHHLSHQGSPRGDCIPHHHDRRFMGAVISQVWVQSPALAVWPQGSHPISLSLGAASVEWRSREPLVPRTAIRFPEWRPLGWMPLLWAEVLALGLQPPPTPRRAQSGAVGRMGTDSLLESQPLGPGWGLGMDTKCVGGG